MNKNWRFFLFLACLGLFLIITPLIIFYVQGYRIDFENKKLVKTGGLFLKIAPKNSEIYIDGIFKKEINFFSDSALIENLFPKKYEIEAKKNGYKTWKKNLEIKENYVTEAEKIILIPENPKFFLLEKMIEDFFFLPDKKRLVLKEGKENGWGLSLFDLEKNTKTELTSQKNDVSLSNLDFSEDSKKILLELKTKKISKFYILDLSKTPARLTYLDFLSNAEKTSFNPKDNQKIFFVNSTASSSKSLYQADYIKKKISQPIIQDFATFNISSGDIYWISGDGYFFKSDLSGNNKEQMSLQPLYINKKLNYSLFISESDIFLKEENSVYYFKQDSKNFEKIFETISNLNFSPDLKKSALSSDREIWIFNLKDETAQPQRKYLDKVFLTRFSEEIKDLFWYDSYYLIFSTGNKIKIAEIDNRDNLNIFDLAEFKDPKIFWNLNDKKLYILSDGVLYDSEKLIP